MMMMMRELVSILLHTRINESLALRKRAKAARARQKAKTEKFPARRAMVMNKERKTTTPRAHNPSRKDVNARIKRARIHFDHFHARLSDRSTRTARISECEALFFLHGGNHHLSSKSHKRPKTFARKEKKYTSTTTRERKNGTHFLAFRHGLSLPPVARLLWSESRLMPIVFYV